MTHTAAHTQHPCLYIGGEGYKPTCTHTALAGHSYCAEHLALVYKQGSKRATRHKEIRTVSKVRLVDSLMNEAIAELEAEGFDCYGNSELDKQLEFDGRVAEV